MRDDLFIFVSNLTYVITWTPGKVIPTNVVYFVAVFFLLYHSITFVFFASLVVCLVRLYFIKNDNIKNLCLRIYFLRYLDRFVITTAHSIFTAYFLIYPSKVLFFFNLLSYTVLAATILFALASGLNRNAAIL